MYFDTELSESLKLLYPDFANEHRNIVKKYGTFMTKTAFEAIIDFLSSTEGPIPIGAIATHLNEHFSRQKLHLLNPEELIKAIMEFIGPYYNLEVDSYENHREQGNKVLWPVLARYTKNPVQYINMLFTDIAGYFFTHEYISVTEAADFIVQNYRHKYKELPEEAIIQAVDALFDYFAEKGNISAE